MKAQNVIFSFLGLVRSDKMKMKMKTRAFVFIFIASKERPKVKIKYDPVGSYYGILGQRDRWCVKFVGGR